MKRVFGLALGILTAIGGFLDIGDLVTNAVVGSRFGLSLAWVVVVGVLGGPGRYTEKLGGYEGMLAHHRGLAITPEERFRFASLLSLAADDAGLPDDPEFRSALVAYVEWGTRLAMHNSHPGAEVAERAPVPRWGWGEAPPFQP